MVKILIYIYILFFVLFSRNFFPPSLAVHPNKLLIATGQATGHDRREGRVRNAFFLFSLIYFNNSIQQKN